jgi:hypothetical protein
MEKNARAGFTTMMYGNTNLIVVIDIDRTVRLRCPYFDRISAAWCVKNELGYRFNFS